MKASFDGLKNYFFYFIIFLIKNKKIFNLD